MARLSPVVVDELAWRGIAQVEWARRWFRDGKWHGDACGCPDDRCIGFHHDADEGCGCLAALLPPGT
jgi:hypothetical protein